MTLALPARAKLNLDLEVLRRRDDGFHDIRSRLQAVDLHDLLFMTPADQTAITSSGLDVKTAAGNSVLKAHAALEIAAGRLIPTRFHLHKRIPPGSGLGGASSDAAATLRGLASIYRLEIDLQPIAEVLGADVPFFLAGGTAMADGRGERLNRMAVEDAWYAIVWPAIELSTAAVYRAWDEMKEVKSDGRDANQLTRAAAHAEPKLRDFAERLGHGWQMTGSGSAFFRRCMNVEEARRVATGLDGWSAITHSVGPWA